MAYNRKDREDEILDVSKINSKNQLAEGMSHAIFVLRIAELSLQFNMVQNGK